jgi:SP family arabinose:H+ symporter-like MFS transporter
MSRREDYEDLDLDNDINAKDGHMLELDVISRQPARGTRRDSSIDSLELPYSSDPPLSPVAQSKSLYNSGLLSGLTPKGFVWLVSVFSSLSGLLFGLDVGIISGALLFMEATFHLTPRQSEVVVSIVLVGSFVGSLTGGWLSDRLGRWMTIFLATIAYLLGALLMAFSVTNSLWMIYMGRLVIGYAIGVSTLTVTLYLAEVAPASHRGAIVSVNEVAIVTGIFLSFFLNWAVSGVGNERAWRLAFGLTAIPAAIQVLGMFLLPYSPRWLITKGRHVEAMQILLRTRVISEAEAEFKELEGNIQLEQRSIKDLAAELVSPNMRWPLSIAVLLTFFQQASGQPTVLLYSSKIIKLTGIFPDTSTTLLASLIPGSVKLILTILSSFWLIEHLGRRTLLLWGAGGITACLFALGLVMIKHMSLGLVLGWIALLIIATFLGFYAISYGPISWLYMSEVFPQHLRASGMSVATMVNWATQALVSFTFLDALNYFGPTVVFWGYGAVSVIAFAFIFYRVPETKGKTLEELAEIFRSHPPSAIPLEEVDIVLSRSSSDP